MKLCYVMTPAASATPLTPVVVVTGVRFFVSGAYYTQDGVYKEKKNADYDSNISFDRYNLRSNIDFELSKTTRMSA